MVNILIHSKNPADRAHSRRLRAYVVCAGCVYMCVRARTCHTRSSYIYPTSCQLAFLLQKRRKQPENTCTTIHGPPPSARMELSVVHRTYRNLRMRAESCAKSGRTVREDASLKTRRGEKVIVQRIYSASSTMQTHLQHHHSAVLNSTTAPVKKTHKKHSDKHIRTSTSSAITTDISVFIAAEAIFCGRKCWIPATKL